MSTVAIQTGSGEGYSAQVTQGGRLTVDLEELGRILEPVTVRPQPMSVATSTPVVATTSVEIVAARSGRRWIEIQNLGSDPVHIVLASAGTAATASHRRINPGEVYSWCNAVSYEGAVQGIAIGSPSALVVTEFYTS